MSQPTKPTKSTKSTKSEPEPQSRGIDRGEVARSRPVVLVSPTRPGKPRCYSCGYPCAPGQKECEYCHVVFYDPDQEAAAKPVRTAAARARIAAARARIAARAHLAVSEKGADEGDD